MHLYRDEGVVLRTQKLGEADRIITLLTRRHGKVRAVAKGVRRTSSRFGARLEPFGHVDVQFYTGRTLDVITLVETVDGFANLEEIAATPGLDGLFVGPADLSLGLGLGTFADLTDPALLKALDAVVAAADRHRLTPGIHAPSPPSAVAMASRGFRFVSSAVDEDLLRGAAEDAVRAVRDTRPAE